MAMAMERMRRTGSVRGRVGGVRRGTGGRVQWGGVENRTRSVGVSAQYLKRPPGAPAPAGMNAQQQQQRQRAVQDVDVDKENPQFVIFVRSSKIKMWYPLNLVSGGPLAKGLVSGLDNQFFKGMASGALVTQLKQAIYKDIDAVENAARKINKPLASAKKLVYGWKLMDPDDVEGSIQPKGVKELPEMDEDTGTGFDALKDMADNFKTMQESLFGKK